MYADLTPINFRRTLVAILACLRAKMPDGSHVVPMVIGDPGIGKSAMIKIVAKILGVPERVLIASLCDPTDFGGLPVPDKKAGGVKRYPIEQIQACANAPGLLAHDEVTAAPLSCQGPLMRGILEGEYGSTRLDPGSYQVALCNPPEQAPSGVELAAPLRNRFTWFRLVPEVREVIAYMRGDTPDYVAELSQEWDDEAYEEAVRGEALDWAATCEVEAGLLQFTPPASCVEGDAHGWASPRAWERGLRAYVAAQLLGADEEVQMAVLAGSVGQASAITYLGYRDLRKELPTPAEVAKDPGTAKLPDDRSIQIAAIGLIGRVAREHDGWAAWTYADRLRPEIQMAVCNSLMQHPAGRRDAKSPHKRSGMAAMRKIMPAVVKELKGVD